VINIFLAFLLSPFNGFGQAVDSVNSVYQRPFILGNLAAKTAIGGYFEGNSNYFSEDGVSEGFSLEARRFNLFLYSSIHPQIKFFTELEFEHGTEEIALETALLDYLFDPLLVLRGGIIVIPIGYFNQSHDSPKWDFVERPLVSTQIIPSTLSEVGFGLYGKKHIKALTINYDTYLSNGLQDGVVGNAEGRTFLQAGKNEEMIEEDNNGSPAFSGRVGVGYSHWGRVGMSLYHAIYNQYRIEGITVGNKRGVSIYAADFQLRIKKLLLQGEGAYNKIEVPPSLPEIYGIRQWGFYTEVLYPLWEGVLYRWEGTALNLLFRMEAIDYNYILNFAATGDKIYDETWAAAGGLSLRLSPDNVIKFNYRYHWITDAVGNPSRLGGFQFGMATYF